MLTLLILRILFCVAVVLGVVVVWVAVCDSVAVRGVAVGGDVVRIVGLVVVAVGYVVAAIVDGVGSAATVFDHIVATGYVVVRVRVSVQLAFLLLLVVSLLLLCAVLVGGIAGVGVCITVSVVGAPGVALRVGVGVCCVGVVIIVDTVYGSSVVWCWCKW